MNRIHQALRRRQQQSGLEDEAGTTLLELGLSLVIMSMIMTVVVTAMSTFLYSTNDAVKMGQLDEQAALVLDQLQHQIVSANVLYNPAAEGTNAGSNPAPNSSVIAPGWSLRIYTQANGSPTCDQWRVLNTGVVQSRTWSDTNPPTNVSAWRQQMTGVVNSTKAPFTLDPTSTYGGRVLDITLDVETGTTSASVVPISTSVTARNAEFYQPNNDDTADCTPVPSP